jgi:hypothetical protein
MHVLYIFTFSFLLQMALIFKTVLSSQQNLAQGAEHLSSLSHVYSLPLLSTRLSVVFL